MSQQDLPEGATTLAVFQETTSSETSVGTIVQICLVLVDDPSQRFCMISVGDEVAEMGVGEDGPISVESSQLNVAPSAMSTSIIPSSDPTSTGEHISQSSSSSDLPATSNVFSTSVPSLAPASFSALVMSAAIGSPGETSISSSIASIASSFEANSSLEEPSASSSPSSQATSTVLGTSSSADPVQSSSLSSEEVSSTLSAPSSSVLLSPAPTLTDSVLTVTRPIPTASMLNIPSSSPITSADLAAAAANTTSTPGQSIQVLPIGLGVFGGLVVITLSIVGYVLYERGRYKRRFRSRKLAEAKSEAVA